MKIVFKGGDYAEAHIVANMLENEGIKAYVGGHFLQGALGDIGAANLIDVRVEEQDVARAETIIEIYDTYIPEENQQQSLGNKEPVFNKSFASFTALAFIAALLALMLLNL